MAIFNFLGSILGYLLWFLYVVVKNYGVAIILFTIILKAVLFPFSIKQQKSMAAQAKLSGKQKELQEKYGKNRAKYNEELQKLYEKEGTSPGAGCLTAIVPMLVMLGIFYSVIYPLSNTLHISSESIEAAKAFYTKIPGVTAVGNYPELAIIKNFDALSVYIAQFFTETEMANMALLSKGFNFLGINLLATPQGSPFGAIWFIPIISVLVSFGSQFYMTKTTQSMQKQPGCSKWMMYLMPLISVWWAWMMPGAVGFYSIISAITSFLQSFVTNTFFSVNHMTAMTEAQRELALETGEAALKPLPVTAQREIAERLSQTVQPKQEQKGNKAKTGTKKSTGKKTSGADSNSYMGNKK